MRVNELRAVLASLPDDAEVIVSVTHIDDDGDVSAEVTAGVEEMTATHGLSARPAGYPDRFIEDWTAYETGLTQRGLRADRRGWTNAVRLSIRNR